MEGRRLRRPPQLGTDSGAYLRGPRACKVHRARELAIGATRLIIYAFCSGGPGWESRRERVREWTPPQHSLPLFGFVPCEITVKFLCGTEITRVYCRAYLVSCTALQSLGKEVKGCKVPLASAHSVRCTEVNSAQPRASASLQQSLCMDMK